MNNPLNLTYAKGICWQGSNHYLFPGRFESFTDMPHAVRAYARQLYDDIVIDGQNTPNLLAVKWVGPGPVSTYAPNIASALGIGVDDEIEFTRETLNELIYQLGINEESVQIADNDIEAGLDLAESSWPDIYGTGTSITYDNCPPTNNPNTQTSDTTQPTGNNTVPQTAGERVQTAGFSFWEGLLISGFVFGFLRSITNGRN